MTAAGGAIWGEIDEAAAAHNLSCVGGTVNKTGVAGYTTGGGFGWLSGQYGLAIDNLLSAEIVLADGRIASCSPTQEPDLFWAIRGAGHMFGILTSFTFRAYQQGPVYGGMVVFPPTPAAVNHLITFANHIQSSSSGRTAMFCGFTTPPFMPGKRVIFGTCFHDGPASEGAAIFSPLIANAPVPPLKNALTAMSYQAMNEVLALAANSEGRRVSKGACYSGALPPAAFQKVLDMYEDFVANTCPEAGESGACLFEFYPLDKVCAVAPDETAFVNRQKHSNAMCIPRWRSAKYDGACRQFTRDAMDALKKAVDEHGGETGEYLNYDGLGTPAQKTFGLNYERLAALKARYDPRNVFDKVSGLRAPERDGASPERGLEGPVEKKARLEEEMGGGGGEREREREPEQRNGQLTPPTSNDGDGEAEKVTHEVVISARRGGSEEGSGKKTEEIAEEVRRALSRIAGANVLVSVTGGEEEMKGVA